MDHPTDMIAHTTAFVTPVVEYWLEREIVQWVHPTKDRSDDPSHHEWTLLPRSYNSLPWLEREIAQWVHPTKDRSDDPSHREWTLLQRSYISLSEQLLINRANFVIKEKKERTGNSLFLSLWRWGFVSVQCSSTNLFEWNSGIFGHGVERRILVFEKSARAVELLNQTLIEQKDSEMENKYANKHIQWRLLKFIIRHKRVNN